MSGECPLSVVIPTYNRPGRARQVVESLLRQISETNSAIEVIVVDDGSDAACARATGEALAHLKSTAVRYLPLPANGGASAARNAGTAASRGAVIAFLDDDIVPADDYVRAILRSHAQHPEALVINGNLRTRQTSVYAEFWFYYYDAVFNRPGQTFFTIEMLASGHCSVKRTLLERVQPLFDAGLTSGEDFDLYLRLKALGIPSWKDDAILASIETRTTLLAFLKQRVWYARGHGQLVAKHGAEATRRVLAPPNPRFWHLYALIRLAHRATRYYRAASRLARSGVRGAQGTT